MRIEKIAVMLFAAALLATGCGRDEPAESVQSEASADAGASTSATTTAQRYPAKSGIIESRATGMLETTTTVYFDDGGAREATYSTSVMTMMGHRVETVSAEIRDGDWLYRYDEDDDRWEKWNMAEFFKAGASLPAGVSLPGGGQGSGVESMVGDAMKGASDAKTLPARTIAGKEATGLEMDMMGMKVRMWTWENITLRSEVEMGSEPTVTEVVSLQLGVPVPADKFRPPAGATVVDGVKN